MKVFSLIILISVSIFLISSIDQWVKPSYLSKVSSQVFNKVNVDDQLFFPVGFYYVDYDSEPSHVIQGQLAALKQISDSGFNTLHASINNCVADHKTLLKAAERLGISIISDHQSDASFKDSVNQFKSFPALIGWSIGDDVNSRYQPRQILERHQQAKAIDPQRFTYISMFDPDPKVIQPYLPTANVIGMQSYPVSERSLNSTFSEIRTAVETSRKYHGAAVIANLQSFQWQDTDRQGNPQRIPTPEEVRNMTYQALIAGAQGILYYTYRDEHWFLPEHPALWAELRSLATEINQLKPLLLEFSPSQIELNADLLAGIWNADHHDILVLVNASDRPQSFNVPLPKKRSTAKLLFDQPLTLPLKQGHLTGSILPLNVQIYHLT